MTLPKQNRGLKGDRSLLRKQVRKQNCRPKRGAVVLEAIVALPVLLIAILAIVELGLLSTNQSAVQMASVAGADAATSTPLPTTGPVPTEIVSAVTAILQCHGVKQKCIRIEHNVGTAPPYVLETGILTSPSLAPLPRLGHYVRVTVCVETSQLAPNLLAAFHVDLDGNFSQHTTTRCY